MWYPFHVQLPRIVLKSFFRRSFFKIYLCHWHSQQNKWIASIALNKHFPSPGYNCIFIPWLMNWISLKISDLTNFFNIHPTFTINLIGWLGTCRSSTVTLPVETDKFVRELLVGMLKVNFEIFFISRLQNSYTLNFEILTGRYSSHQILAWMPVRSDVKLEVLLLSCDATIWVVMKENLKQMI